MKTLILKFSGPMQSWGTGSHFETRHTDLYPSKSGIIGLLAAALGYRRNEDEKITSLNKLDIAVRIDQPGRLLKDYQIARRQDKNKVYVTNRYYLEDAVFLVAIGSLDEDQIEEVERAIKRPYFSLSLGRRSLPIPAKFIYKTTNKNALQSLQDCPWEASKWTMRRHHTKEVILDIYHDRKLCEGSSYKNRRDQVISFSEKSRRYSYRQESKSQVLVLNPEFSPVEVDYFSAVNP